MQQLTSPAPEKEHEVGTCRHYWVIDAPTGPTSRGVCQVCRETRDFKNYIEAAPWGDDTPSVRTDSPMSAVGASEAPEEPEEL